MSNKIQTLTDPGSIYYEAALRQIPRLLSWQDRECFSKTFGCFDRTYWGWKFTDFPGARFQEAIYVLAFFFTHSIESNKLAGDLLCLAWVKAGIKYWQKLQHKNGSFDEAYPFEYSLAATAFTSFYIGEAFLRIKNYLPEQDQNNIRQTFARSGDWLCRNDEYHGILSNHLAAAAAAVYVIYRICSDVKYKHRMDYFLSCIYDHQSTEGWYEEYGGADPGYQTHGMFYLARIWQYTKDERLLESLDRGIRFSKYFIHPNGTLGGEYESRNTEFYFPAGFEMLAPVLPDAALITKFMRDSVANQRAAGFDTMDLYNFIPLYNNYLFAAECAMILNKTNTELPCFEIGEYFYPDAGLYVKSTSKYYAVLGLSKGGILKLYDRERNTLCKSDCGYWAKINTGEIVSNQSLNKSKNWDILPDKIIIHSDFVKINQRLQNPWQFIGFRLSSMTLGRYSVFAYWIKNLLVKMLIKRRKKVTLHNTRTIQFENDRIHISDQIERKNNLQVEGLYAGAKFATIHMGSSRYFQYQELDMKYNDAVNLAEPLMRRDTITVDNMLCIDTLNKKSK